MFSHKAERRRTYLWQRSDWPQWRFDAAALAAPLAQVHRAQGHLAGRMAGLGLAERDQATLQTLTQEVITTSAIEGEALNLDAVRSCVVRRLGVDIGALAPADRNIDGVDGKLTNARWTAMGKCSADTALRDINDLLARGVLRKLEGGGRSTGYLLVK